MSANIEALYFMGSQFLGSGRRPLVWGGATGTTLHPPTGKALFCPICAEVWFRCLVPGEVTSIWEKVCEKHQPGEAFGHFSTGSFSWSLPGSILQIWDREWNDNLPDCLVSHELRMHLRWLAFQADEELAPLARDMLGFI